MDIQQTHNETLFVLPSSPNSTTNLPSPYGDANLISTISRSTNSEETTSKKEISLNDQDVSHHAGDSDFPDGGWQAWLVVFGASCNTFSTFGFVNAWGTFQAYYQQTILSGHPPSDIAWIGSVQYSLIFLPGMVSGWLFDLGYFKSVLLTSSIVLVTATFLVAECKVYWQFLLCQGFAIGFSCAFLFGPTTAVVGHWFKQRRGIAMGYIAGASSIGSAIFPIAIKNLIPIVGFPWTMRIIGFILMVSVGLANLTMRRRLPPTKSKGRLLNLGAFKSVPYTLYCLSAFVCFLGLFTTLTYLDYFALQIGLSPDIAFYLVAIANAASIFGRFTSGVIGDIFGPMNVMIPFNTFAAVLTYAWPFARTKASLITLAVLYGFSSGAYVTLLSNPVMELSPTEDLGRRLGMLMSIFALGALAGPPISGAIKTASGGFEAMGIYAGTMVMVAVGLMCLTRYLVLGRSIGKF